MKKTMARKIICVTLASLFLLNQLCYGLGTQPGSSQPGVRNGMYALGQKLFAIKRGPGAIDWDQYTSREFRGDVPQIPGITYTVVDYDNLPERLAKSSFFGNINKVEGMRDPKTGNIDLIRAATYWMHTEAQIPQGALEIKEGYFDIKETDGELGIARIERHRGGKLVLIIHSDFVKKWNYIAGHDTWFEITLNGEKRLASVAWGLFFRLMKHEMTDLAKAEPHFPKGAMGHITGSFGDMGHITASFGNGIYVSGEGDDREAAEFSANAIAGRFRYVNDAIWMWFLGGYCYSDTTRYNNDTLKERLNWFFNPETPEDRKLKLNLEFPNLLANDDARDEAISMALLINHAFFGSGTEVPKIDRPAASIDEYKVRKADIVGQPIYATGKGESETIWRSPSEVLPEKRVVMLISGGEAAGVNNYFALQAKKLAKEGYSVEAVKFGLDGLVKAKVEFDGTRVWVDWTKSEKIMDMPGAFEGTARVKLKDGDNMANAIANLKDYCKTVIIIGGNDHIGEADELAHELKKLSIDDMLVIALPKTIDRDTKEYPIGASSAAEYAREFVERAKARPGSGTCVVIQSMGRDMGYLTAASADLNDPTVFVALPEYGASLEDIVKAARERIAKYGAATIVVSEGFKISVPKEGTPAYHEYMAAHPVVKKVLENPFLKAKLKKFMTDPKSRDAQGNLKVSELGIADFVMEALSLELGLERDENLLLEDTGYSCRSREPNELDRRIAEQSTTAVAALITDKSRREDAIRRGGVCVAAPRNIRTVDEAIVKVIDLKDATGKVSLIDSGIYTEGELKAMNIPGLAGSTIDNLPDIPMTREEAKSGYNFELVVNAINSQAESNRDMNRAGVCVMARDEADEIIEALSSRAPISEADSYVMERTKDAVLYVTSAKPMAFSDIIRRAYEIKEKLGFVNVVVSWGLRISKNDPVLTAMRKDEVASALIESGKPDGKGNLVFGRRLAELIYTALSSEDALNALKAQGVKAKKAMSGIRKNILGGSLNLLPGEVLSLSKPAQPRSTATPAAPRELQSKLTPADIERLIKTFESARLETDVAKLDDAQLEGIAAAVTSSDRKLRAAAAKLKRTIALQQGIAEGNVPHVGNQWYYERKASTYASYLNRLEQLEDQAQPSPTKPVAPSWLRSRAGKSYWDAVEVIGWYDILREWHFTLPEYIEYRNLRFGGSISETQARDDLKKLAERGILTMDDNAKPYIYKVRALTADDIAAIARKVWSRSEHPLFLENLIKFLVTDPKVLRSARSGIKKGSAMQDEAPLDLLSKRIAELEKPLSKSAQPRDERGRFKKHPGKSPDDVLLLAALYVPQDAPISAPGMLKLYEAYWENYKFERPADNLASALRTMERDIFGGDDSLLKRGIVKELAQKGETGEKLFGLTPKGLIEEDIRFLRYMASDNVRSCFIAPAADELIKIGYKPDDQIKALKSLADKPETGAVDRVSTSAALLDAGVEPEKQVQLLSKTKVLIPFRVRAYEALGRYGHEKDEQVKQLEGIVAAYKDIKVVMRARAALWRLNHKRDEQEAFFIEKVKNENISRDILVPAALILLEAGYEPEKQIRILRNPELPFELRIEASGALVRHARKLEIIAAEKAPANPEAMFEIPAGLVAESAPETRPVEARDVRELLANIEKTTRLTKDSVIVTDRARFVNETVDYLAFEAALNQNLDVKASAERILREAAQSFGLKLASIHDFYMKKQDGRWANITVPAVNGRADVYHQYQQLFRVAKEKDVRTLVLELARSEMRYAAQDAAEFTAISLAAAIKQGYEGLIFCQGDHYQVSKEKYDKSPEDREKELKSMEDLIRKAMLAGIYNIDIDPSTLVDESTLDRIVKFENSFVDRYLKTHNELLADLDENGVKSLRRRLVDEIEMGKIEFLSTEEKQEIESLYKQMHTTNAEVTMRFVRHIRKLEKELGFPEGFHVSIGIEERHIDNENHKNNPSTVLGSATLMQMISKNTRAEGLVGPSKLSLQTGTMHGIGGRVDFGIYQRHLEFKERIGVAVFVQHGASTLEKHDFDKMREGDVGEVHLATEYQKIEFDIISRLLPQLGEEMARRLTGLMAKDEKMAKKFEAMWNLAFGNPEPAIASIKADDPKGNAKIKLYKELAEAQSRKDRSQIINEILGDSMPKGLKGTLKDLVKELSAPFKKQLWNLPRKVRAAVDKALYEEFSVILEKLGTSNTKDIVEEIVPFGKQPVVLPAKAEHPLIQVISVFAVRIGQDIGPGSPSLTRDQTQAIWEAVNFFHDDKTQLEILIPQHIKLTDDMEKTLRDIKRREEQEIVSCKPYDRKNIESLLRAKDSRVKRIVITTNDTNGIFKELASNMPEIFRGERLLNIELPKDYDRMDSVEKTVHQARLMMIAIFGRLLEKDSTPFMKAILMEMLKNHLPQGVSEKEFVERLAGYEDETTDITNVKERILYFLGKVVSLIERLGEELKFMKEFWKSA